jgi:F-type H+-transporting ATPase subunit c
MTKKMILSVVLLLVASPMLFAQDANVATQSKAWEAIGAAIGMAIASGLCGLGQGKAVAGATEAMARNPGAIGAIRTMLILGLVLIESLALYTLVIVIRASGLLG